MATKLKMYKEYFGILLKAEINKQTIEQARKNVKNKYNELKKDYSRYSSELNKRVDYLDNNKNAKEEKTKSYKGDAKFGLAFWGILLIVGIVGAIIFSAIVYKNFFSSNPAFSLVIPLIYCILLIVFSVKNFFKNLKKYKRSAKNAAKEWDETKSTLTEEIQICENSIAILKSRMQYLSQVYDNLNTELSVAIENLRKLYSARLLAAKYIGNVVAIGAFYDYLSSGRCTSITGHGGIYDTFEHDSQLQTIMKKIDIVILQNNTIIQGIYELNSSVQESNRLISDLHSELENGLERIGKSIGRVEQTSAQAAIHANNIDNNTAYLRWNSYWYSN